MFPFLYLQTILTIFKQTFQICSIFASYIKIICYYNIWQNCCYFNSILHVLFRLNYQLIMKQWQVSYTSQYNRQGTCLELLKSILYHWCLTLTVFLKGTWLNLVIFQIRLYNVQQYFNELYITSSKNNIVGKIFGV